MEDLIVLYSQVRTEYGEKDVAGHGNNRQEVRWKATRRCGSNDGQIFIKAALAGAADLD